MPHWGKRGTGGVTTGMEKEKQDYLEGATPYPADVIREYTEKGWWLNLTFGDVLDRSVERGAQKTAVIDSRTRMTYAELREKVDRFALALLERGFRKYDRVILQLPNRSEFVVAFYGLQRIGAVPVLAIPRHSYREITHFFKLTDAVGWILPLLEGNLEFRALIDSVRPQARSLRHLVVVDDGESLPADALSMESLLAEVNPSDHPKDYLYRFRPDPNDVALILLTGGTTGMPKGVPRTHNSYLTNIRYTNMDTTPEDVRALATPIGHSMAHQGPVGGSIFFGATLCLIDSPRAKAIVEAVERHRVTKLGLVPTQLEDILNLPDLERYDLSSLRFVGTAGAAMNPETVLRAKTFFRDIGAEFKGAAFGSSEGPCATHYEGEPEEVFRRSIGRPMCEGDQWKAIDDKEQELPPDTEGELVAKGPCVFTGYYRSEAENREIFTRDGYYKMGDLGKMDKAGHIFITGRKKDIIQRGGEGIIPSEIENLIRLHPAVEAAAVVGMPDPRLGERACAFVVLKQGKRLAFEEMVEFLKSQGAGVMLLPERLETVGQLPKTAVGKIDKKVLRVKIEEKLRNEGVL
jgi:non-ribosomal peptide synthetase component E (peptide arylation enzyme)